MKHYGNSSSKALLLAVLLLSGAVIVLAALPLLSGHRPNLLAIVLNLPVVLVVLFQSRFTRPIVLTWAALPVVSCVLYLVASALRGSFGAWPGPVFFGLAAVVGVVLFLWARLALAPSSA